MFSKRTRLLINYNAFALFFFFLNKPLEIFKWKFTLIQSGGRVGRVGTGGTVDTVGTVGTVGAVGAVGAVGTVGTVGTVCTLVNF